MTFLWRPDRTNFGKQHQILTYVWQEDYCYPPGFTVGENLVSEDPFVTDKSLSTFNANEKMTQFINFIQNDTHYRKGQDILIPMGCDFAFQNAQEEFAQVESIINYINQNNKANIVLKLSTPSMYVEAIKQ